jgi:hypothetical protein
MSDSSSSSADAPPPRNRRRRYGRSVFWIAGLAGLAVLALIGAAIAPWSAGDSKSSTTTFGVRRLAERSTQTHPLPDHPTKVFGSNIDAKTYGSIIAAQEYRGVDANGQPISDLDPLAPRAFNAPVAAYRSYAERWSAKLAGEVPVLKGALASGDRDAAKRAWSDAYDDYLHLGAVYGLLPGPIDQRIDGMPGRLAGAAHDPGFIGLHRIEMGLWTGAAPASLVALATRLQHDVGDLQRALPALQVEPLDYATRAHEILEDAQRDLMTGTDVRWSGAGVLGTAAGLAATREVIGTLTSLLQGRDNTLAQVQSWLLRMQLALDRVRDAHHGKWPALSQLTTAQHDLVKGTLTGTLVALSLVPGTLETTRPAQIPKLPQNAGQSG